MLKKIKLIPCLAAAVTASVAAFAIILFTGCESSGSSSDGGGSGDAVSFSKLKFVYGSDYSGAKAEGVKISNLSVGSNSWSFTFDTDMSAWGYGSGHLEPLCAFMKTRDGKWMGGMMHWQSSTNPAGNFHNVYPPGYNGFKDIFNHIDNPCEIAFVLIDAKGNRRSNVIKTTWQR